MNSNDKKVVPYTTKQSVKVNTLSDKQIPEFLKIALMAGLVAFFSKAAQELSKLIEN